MLWFCYNELLFMFVAIMTWWYSCLTMYSFILYVCWLDFMCWSFDVHDYDLMNIFYWLVWSWWMCIKVFKEKCILYEMFLFLAYFQSMCAYGLILSTNGVLTLFFPFPQHFKFRSLKGFWRWLWRRLGILVLPSWVGPHYSRATPILSYEVVLVLRLIFLSFDLSTKHYMTYMCFYCIDELAKPNLICTY